ncbi:hypothetical protein [Streptomyces cinnamoneus]|uniref:hypothetical protein n=1 Tax=Streptomyces cinnamoneus TaxID=53446 RepID=UPI0026BAB170
MDRRLGADDAFLSDPSGMDAVLARGRPFGDSGYLREQTQAAFTFRLEKMAAFLPVARPLLTALERAGEPARYRVLGDPLVRYALQQLLTRFVTGRRAALAFEVCEAVLAETAHRLTAGATSGPLRDGSPEARHVGDASRTPWIWGEGPRDDMCARAFRHVVAHEYGGAPCAPSAGDVVMLRKATRLLGEILPETSRSALGHAHVVGVTPGVGAWRGKSSSSQFRLAGAVFLNRRMFRNPWWVAEALLHECLHQKLYDFRHAHSLLARDARGTGGGTAGGLLDELRKVVALWNSPGLEAGNLWDAQRAVAAFHVYVHVALFSTLAERRAPELRAVYGPPDAPCAMTPSRTAFERAHYLGEGLRSVCWAELGPAGRRMVDWLSSVLGAVDPAPPPPGSSLHLLLDRYLAEARRIEKVPPAGALVQRLAALREAEVDSTRAVLTGLGAQEQLDVLGCVPAQPSAQDEGAAFAETRRLIADTLLRLAPDGYSLNSLCPAARVPPDEMVRQMVEASSRELAVAGGLA